ncbi:MAG TPA: (Fe-S)-binding protein [Chromatiales bacterium]|nr:(Fe-S)-binding protein [Chromatiales bacterium]
MSKVNIERGIRVLKEQIDAPVAAFFSSCVHCGHCADACLFYTEDPDPKYTPIHKLEPMRRVWEQEYTLVGKLKKLLGLSKPVTDTELEQWEPLVYDSCTLCGRCSMVCPVGNDITYMLRKMREAMAATGHAPEGLVGAATRAIEIGSPMGIKLPALKAQIRHVKEDTGLDVPLDKQDADYMLVLSSMEVINFPETIAALAKIFDQAGINWTLSSEAFEATNAGIQIGISEVAEELVRRVVDAAEKLKVKTVITPECGHAYTALRWEGPNLIGRHYGFKVQHILEVLDDLQNEGRLKLEGRETDRLTYHDPCQISRRGGVINEPHRLLDTITSNFVDMKDHGDMNWCCGAGGGVSSNERADEIRLTAFKRKKLQLEQVKAQGLVSACANCRMQLEEGLEENNMDIPVLSLTEMIAEHMTASGGKQS